MSEIKYCDLFNIRTKIGVNQSERLVFMCRKQISKGSEITTQNVLGLFEELEKQDNLGIDRLGTLKEILKQLKNRSMLKKVEEFEIKRKGDQLMLKSYEKLICDPISVFQGVYHGIENFISSGIH